MTIRYTAYSDEELKEIKEKSLNLLPAGVHRYRVMKSVQQISKSGNDMFTVDLNIWDDTGTIHSIKNWFVFTDGMLYKFKHFLESAGHPELYGKDIEAHEILGFEGEVKTIIETAQVEKKDGSGMQEMKFARVDDFVGAPAGKAQKPGKVQQTQDSFPDEEIPF